MCTACYNAAYGYSAKILPGMMGVECWCRKQIVMVSQPDVMRGRTRTCGLAGCHD